MPRNTDTLYLGESLGPRQELNSRNGLFKLRMEPGGNLVLWDYREEGSEVYADIRWQTRTHESLPKCLEFREVKEGKGRPILVTIETGKVVREPSVFYWRNGVSWFRNGNTYPGRLANRLVLQDDGNLVGYDDDTGLPSEASQTSQDKAHMVAHRVPNGQIAVMFDEAVVSRNAKSRFENKTRERVSIRTREEWIVVEPNGQLQIDPVAAHLRTRRERIYGEMFSFDHERHERHEPERKKYERVYSSDMIYDFYAGDLVHIQLTEVSTALHSSGFKLTASRP